MNKDVLLLLAVLSCSRLCDQLGYYTYSPINSPSSNHCLCIDDVERFAAIVPFSLEWYKPAPPSNPIDERDGEI